MLKWDSLTCHITTRLPGMQYTLWDVWPTEIQAGEVFGDLRSSPPPRASGGRALESKVVAGYVCIRCGLAGFPKHVLCVFFGCENTAGDVFFSIRFLETHLFLGPLGLIEQFAFRKAVSMTIQFLSSQKPPSGKRGGRNQEVWSFGMTFSFEGVGWLQVSSAFPLGV